MAAGGPAARLPALRVPHGGLLGPGLGSGSGATPRGETPGSAFPGGFPFDESSGALSALSSQQMDILGLRQGGPRADVYPAQMRRHCKCARAERQSCTRGRPVGRQKALRCPVSVPEGRLTPAPSLPCPCVAPKRCGLPDRVAGRTVPAQRRGLRPPRHAHAIQTMHEPCQLGNTRSRTLLLLATRPLAQHATCARTEAWTHTHLCVAKHSLRPALLLLRTALQPS
jgi:hypothetical protein